eukprot:628487-Amphidinium_carterae.2
MSHVGQEPEKYGFLVQTYSRLQKVGMLHAPRSKDCAGHEVVAPSYSMVDVDRTGVATPASTLTASHTVMRYSDVKRICLLVPLRAPG